MISFQSFFRRNALCVLALALVALTACDAVPTYDDNASAGRYIQMAPIAPPPPMFEEIPESRNMRTEIWRPGYWNYSGGNYYWVSGEFIARPSPTAVWSPDHWMHHTYGWGFVPGYWQ